MKVTSQQLKDNGAILSQSYIFKLSCSVGYVTHNGYVEALFDTEKIKKGIANKRSNVAKAMKVAHKHRANMNKILDSLETAIFNLEVKWKELS